MSLYVPAPHHFQAKHLQFVSGVNAFSYWLGNYAWDLINAVIIVITAWIAFATFQVDGYKGSALGAVFFLMVSVCICTHVNQSYMYLCLS